MATEVPQMDAPLTPEMMALLDQAIAGKLPAKPATATPPAAAPPATSAVAEPPPAANPPDVGATPPPVDTGTEAEKISKRYRINDLDPLKQMTIHLLATNPDLNPEDAARMARERTGIAAPGASAQGNGNGNGTHGNDQADSRSAAPPPLPSSSDIKARLTEIKTKLKALGNDGGLMTPEFADLNIEHGELNAELLRAEAEEDQEEQKAGRARNASLARARAMHADIANPQSPLSQEVARVMADLPADILSRADAPEVVARTAMANMGMPLTTTQANAGQVTQPPPGARPVPPVLGGANANTTGAKPPPPTKAELEVAIGQMSPEQLDKALYGHLHRKTPLIIG